MILDGFFAGFLPKYEKDLSKKVKKLRVEHTNKYVYLFSFLGAFYHLGNFSFFEHAQPGTTYTHLFMTKKDLSEKGDNGVNGFNGLIGLM